MAKRIIPKQDNPIPPIPGLRVFTKEEALARSKARREGKLKPDALANVELLPADANRIRKRHNVTLSSEASRIARMLADGNVSRGIERALLHYADCKKRK